ncbi:transcriptional regulator FnrL [Roseicitreum antarcticum]|uniref:CRP/FNR family transcriptional regulator, anaerobic regulatory protein n=1 Tax=Roseicitreum antarcticum TaxID=564137 RepID=A0A1H3BGN3_9RHOB|nr:Crp/Fnr family transcriptional regulator [Roseicitreum antarcticum]SDX41103.1 CRP/FNR family transcriptional regulator, anaerobic regulatory protein [Roseicitreum antarcticum]
MTKATTTHDQPPARVAAQVSALLQDCNDCPIRHRAVCARCEADELQHLEEIKYYRSFEAGQTVVWSGDRMDFVASVVTGIATLTQTMEDGRRQMVGLLLPSDFVGRPGRPTAAYDVTATTDLVMCCFRKKPFEDMMLRTPHIGQRLLEMTLDELDAAREWMLLLGRKTAREKIASLITIIARRNASLNQASMGDSLIFELPLTREAMSEYLGLTLETVSRQISALRRDGVIVVEGKRRVTIPDLDRLIEETGDDTDGGFLI